MRRIPGMVLVMVLIAAFGAAPLAAPAVAQNGPTITDDLLAEFETFIEAEMAFYHIPGAAVAVIQDGHVVYARGFGMRDVETGDPFTTETLFRVGSTTKSMTSLLVAQLVDEGLLTWDTPVIDLLPDFAAPTDELTALIRVRDLLGMATGLESESLDSLGWSAWTVDDLLSAVAGMHVVGEFGAHYFYSNEVYALAGYVAAVAAGREPTLDAYDALMHERVFDPVGMASTAITDDVTQLGDNVSRSYSATLSDGIAVPNAVRPASLNVVAPAGAVWSNLDDMARYLVTQMNGGVTPGGQRLVSAENLAETWQGGVLMGGADPDMGTGEKRYGMGWVSFDWHGEPVLFHDGGWEGYRTYMTFLPGANVGVLVFANHVFGDLFNPAVTYSFVELLYGTAPEAAARLRQGFEESYGDIETELGTLPPLEVDAEQVAPFLGAYEGGWTLELREDSTLWAVRPGWEFLLHPLNAPGVFLTEDLSLGVVIMLRENDYGPFIAIQGSTGLMRYYRLP